MGLGDVVRVYIGASGWHAAFVVGLDAGQVKLLIDAPRRSREFSDAFASGFDSNGLMWIDPSSSRMRRTRELSTRRG